MDTINEMIAGQGNRPLWPRIVYAIRTSPLERKFLWILLAIFIAKGVLFTFVFPPFSGHDEIAHFTYLEFVAQDFRPPVIPDLESWQATYAETRNQRTHDLIDPELWQYCRYITDDWYHGCSDPALEDTPVYAITLGPDNFLPSGWVYTANHPPLYYLLMTPVYWLFAGASVVTKLYALRLAAIPFGLLTVFFAYKTTREIFPRDRFLALLIPAFVAFQPQIAYEAAMLNNDILSIAFTSIIFYLLAVGLRRGFSWRICILTGFTFGLAMLSKNTSAVSGLVIGVAMILGIGVRNWRVWIPKGAATAGVGGLLIWPWFLYMWTTYGDFTGLSRIEKLQYWNNAGRSVWSQLIDGKFAWLRWRETWGEFGWRLIPLDDTLLRIILGFCVIGMLGVAWWAVQSFAITKGRKLSMRSDDGNISLPRFARVDSNDASNAPDTIFMPDHVVRISVLTFVLACVIAYYAILQFGTSFSLTQARYYFPSVNAFAVLVLLGYRALIPHRWHHYAEAAILLALFGLNIIIFSEYLIPYWNPSI